MAINTPILFVIFNRPDRVSRVWAEIKKAQPKRLFIAADGARANKPGEKELCQEARDIVSDIDWDCEVSRDFSDTNLGCSERVYSAINWIFRESETAIIIEDDCLPSQSFFTFCDEMLEKYRDYPQIMQVAGFNFINEWKKDAQDYHFSNYGGVWGWASWRRAWTLYDPEMKGWQDKKIKNQTKKTLGNYKQSWARNSLFKVGHTTNAWEYKWAFTRSLHKGLVIVPAVSLISNIGFGSEATHTKEKTSPLEKIERHELIFPLRPNDKIKADFEYDKRLFEVMHPEFRHSWPIIFLIKIWNKLTQ